MNSAHSMGTFSVPVTEDFLITVEVKRVDGETWVRALIDGHEPIEVETMAALVSRVLPGLIHFAVKHAPHSLPEEGPDGLG
jgi:hypothetical protein